MANAAVGQRLLSKTPKDADLTQFVGHVGLF